ncbi:hypothetical protein ACWKSP_31120 [Micromonosporaceae bacterium Da 78-11]
MTDEPIDHELRQIAGNPRITRAVKSSLEHLSTETASPELAEMARELLAGRTDLRAAASSSAYATQLTEAAEGFRKWQADLSPEERAELERTTREQVDDQDSE